MSGNHPPGHGGNPPNPYGNQNGPYGGGDGSQNPPYGQEPPGYANPGPGGHNPGPGYNQYPGVGQPGGSQLGGSQLGGGGGSHLGGGSQLSGGPGGPSGGRNNLVIIAVAAGLAIILAVGAGFLLTRNGGDEVAGGPGDPGGDSSSESQPPQGGKPSDPVQGYLDALAASDAEAAISFAKTPPADKTLLTNDVLTESNERAPITEISVPEVTDEYTARVSAAFKVGEQSVNQDFRVEQVGSEWKITEIVTDLELSRVRANSVPMLINGASVDSDALKVFPGSYEFTTGLKYIDYGKSNVLVIEGPDSYAKTSDVKLAPTAEGVKAFTAAAKAHHKKCLAKKELAPKGCPNIADVDEKAKKGTVKWTVSGDPWADFKPESSYDDPAAIEARFRPTYKVAFTDTKGKKQQYRVFGGSSSYTADLTAEKMKVSLK